MGKISRDNLRKTVYYLKKNGIKNTVLAAMERLQKKEYDQYTYREPSEEILQAQRESVWRKPVLFSIVVPVYHTPEKYFREMVESVLNQTYPFFELILADAGEDDKLRPLAEDYEDIRIRYIKLVDNAGIAENTNQAIRAAQGDYIALFDHDDLLTPDALYEMAAVLQWSDDKNLAPVLLYSDEDKCDGEAKRFYDPHIKKDYDPELLLTNNYICHFTAVKADVMKRLLFRKEFDGAQDFDLVLRVAAETAPEKIRHISKVLYHWRCHIDSTAANPQSKRYAYEAGKRAVLDHIKQKGWDADVTHLKHLGFYRVEYREDIFDSRSEVGAVGGRVLNRGRIVGGMMDRDGHVIFEGLQDGFSGYVNRAALVQQADALDIRCIKVNPACQKLFEEIVGSAYCTTESGTYHWAILPKESDYRKISLLVSRALTDAGYVLLWDPQLSER